MPRRAIKKVTPMHLKRWRKSCGYSKPQAASVLGIHINTYKNYERGYRDNGTREVPIPYTVWMACVAHKSGMV